MALPRPSTRFTALAGLAGAAILLLASVIPAVPYQGTRGEAYSPLNHFISELGQRGVSELAAVFNGGLIVGGIVVGLFMLGMGIRVGTRLGRVAGIVGTLAALACTGVGMVPMNDLPKHAAVAMAFFYLTLLTVALFSAAIALAPHRPLPRILALPGLAPFAALVLFLTTPIPDEIKQQVRQGGLLNFDPAKFRPEGIWWLTFWEWMVLVTVLAWVAIIAAYLLRDSRRGVSIVS